MHVYTYIYNMCIYIYLYIYIHTHWHWGGADGSPSTGSSRPGPWPAPHLTQRPRWLGSGGFRVPLKGSFQGSFKGIHKGSLKGSFKGSIGPRGFSVHAVELVDDCQVVVGSYGFGLGRLRIGLLGSRSGLGVRLRLHTLDTLNP